MNLGELQREMTARGIHGWLVWDFRNSNPMLARLLPLPKGHASGKRHLTRRDALWIPSSGEPIVLAHGIDRAAFESESGGGGRLLSGDRARVESYLTWQELGAWVEQRVKGKKVAMEYVARGVLPVASIVDAGTVEMVQACGAEVVSSADLIQVCVARWSAGALESHEWASREVTRIKDDAFEFIRARLWGANRVNEHEVQQHILKDFKKTGLETPDPPIVAVNDHGADPHFEVSEKHPADIHRGDWILIDLWARRPGDENIYSDITWVAWAAPRPGAAVPERHGKVFEAVKAGRDAAVKLAQDRWKAKQVVQGWELDDATRGVIEKAGYGKFIKHRTGHSLSAGPMVHGVGVNIDNLETHDTREVMAGVGFTVEPGVYVPSDPEGSGFGVRLEINVYADPQQGPRVTSCIQNEVVIV